MLDNISNRARRARKGGVMITLDNVMLCWNERTKDIGLLEWPTKYQFGRDVPYDSDYGAKFQNTWPKLNKDQKVLALITEGIWLIRKHGFSVESVFKCLEQLPEVDYWLKHSM